GGLRPARPFVEPQLPKKGESRATPGADDVRVGDDRRHCGMAQTEVHILEDTEHEKIVRWRAEELERAGDGPRGAGGLAARHDIDLHRAIELLDQGCPPDLATKILL